MLFFLLNIDLFSTSKRVYKAIPKVGFYNRAGERKKLSVSAVVCCSQWSKFENMNIRGIQHFLDQTRPDQTRPDQTRPDQTR